MVTLVAIKSVAFPNHFVSLDGQNVTSPTGPGGGSTKIQTFIGAWETFILQHNDDGTVSFQSIAFNNVLLRADGTGVPEGQNLSDGGGIVNAQFSAGGGAYEKFLIQKQESAANGYLGVVGIESAAFPGRFLRLDNDTARVNVQGIFSRYEAFEILVLG